MQLKMKSGIVRCSGALAGTGAHAGLTMMISGSRPSPPPTHTGPTSLSTDTVLPDRQDRIANRLCASRPKISTMQKPPNCRLQQKTSHSGDPEDGPISPPSFIVVGCPRRFARGQWVRTVPMGPPKAEKKKGLDSVAGEKKWSQRVCLTHRGIFTKAMSYRMASYDRDTFPFARSCLCMHVVLLEAKAGLS